MGESERGGGSGSPIARETPVPLEHIPLHASNLLTVLAADGTIRYESPAIERLFGFRPDELVGEPVSAYFHPDDRDAVVAKFLSIVGTEEFVTEAVEYRHRTADGSYRWVESVASSEPTPGGHYVVNTRDISVQKERERELETKAEELESVNQELISQYRHLFEEAPVMAIVTKKTGDGPVIEACNRRFLEVLGYDRGTVVGDELAEYYTPQSQAALLEEGGYRRALSGEFVREVRELVDVDGEPVETLLRAIPRQGDGDPEGTLAFFIDIRERRDLERENDRLEQFTRIVSHDLRNPLNVASARAELALEDCDSEHLPKVLEAHERMERLIEALLTLARSGMHIVELETVDLGSLIAETWADLPTATGSLRGEVDVSIRADRTRLRQLLENILGNAIDHGGDSVTVEVGPLSDGEGFFIEDDGPGIPDDVKGEVFKPGYSDAADGTGFGLSIARQVAVAHEWDLTVVDGQEGGARFEISGVTTVSMPE